MRTGDFAALAPGVARISLKSGSASRMFLQERGVVMSSTTIIQIVAGVLAVIILIVLIQRRRTRVK
jgi:hypothetical protein